MTKLKAEVDRYAANKNVLHFSSIRPYQKEAIKSVLKTFETNDCTHIVAGGTGKSRVGLWVAEHLKAQCIVVFAPSLALTTQLMKVALLNSIGFRWVLKK